MVSAYISKPSDLAMAAAVYESRPPLRSTTARSSDPSRCGCPDVFVQLKLEPRRHAVGEHPFRERFRFEDTVDRRVQDRRAARREVVPPNHVARKLIVRSILDHELHLVVRRQAIEVAPVV